MHTHRLQLNMFLILSLLGFLFFCSAFFLLPLPESENQVWQGYHTILFERTSKLEEAELMQIEDAFLAAGFAEVIHYHNAIVEYSDFTKLNPIKLADVSFRFEELDPRLDSYLTSLPEYFFSQDGSKEYSILYILEKQRRLPSIAQCIRVLRSLPFKWRFVDVKPLLVSIMVSLFAVVLVLVLLSDRSKWPFLLAAGMPWFPLIAFGGFIPFVSATMILVTFSVFFRYYRPVFRFFLNHGYRDGGSRKARSALIFLGLAVLAAFILQLSSRPDILPVLRLAFVLTATGFLFFFYTIATVFRQKRQEHRLFFRVPLTHRREHGWICYFCIFVIIVLSPAVLKVQGFAQNPPVPVPFVLGDVEDYSIEAVEELNRTKAAALKAGRYDSLLPDIADYITHLAYQESFLFDRGYTFPEVGERVGISGFTGTGSGGVEKEFLEMLVFSNDWFMGILSQDKPVGLPGLWLRQGKPVASQVMSRSPLTVSRQFLFRHIAFCLIIFVPIVFFNNRLTPQLMYGIKSLMLRRKRQEA